MHAELRSRVSKQREQCAKTSPLCSCPPFRWVFSLFLFRRTRSPVKKSQQCCDFRGRVFARRAAKRSERARDSICKKESAMLHHQRNLFCLPQQKRFFLAFWAKNGQNTVKSGFGAVDQPLRSPIFCVQAPETGNNAGVLFTFLCSVKKEQKGVGGRT